MRAWEEPARLRLRCCHMSAAGRAATSPAPLCMSQYSRLQRPPSIRTALVCKEAGLHAAKLLTSAGHGMGRAGQAAPVLLLAVFELYGCHKHCM